MLIGYVGSSDSTSSTNDANGSAPTNTPTPQTTNAQTLQERYGNLARLVSEYAAYQPAGSSTPTPSAPPPSPKSGSDQSASTNPQVQGAVNKIVKAVGAPPPNGSNPTQRVQQLENALAGQPPDVVARALQNPSVQGLLKDAAAWAAEPYKGVSAQDAQENQLAALEASQRLADLTKGLPPAYAQQIVQHSLPTIRKVAGVDANSSGSGAFTNLSNVVASLGDGPQARALTKQIAQNYQRQFQTWQSRFDDPHMGIIQFAVANGASPALSLELARQLQAGGDNQEAQVIINDVCTGANNLAISNNVTTALSDYQQKTADINWLIANLGGGATAQQVNRAVQNYMNQQRPAWKAAYQQDRTTLQASGKNLATDIAQLEALPNDLQTPQVSSTLKSLAGNQSVQQTIGLALANDPASVVGSDGKQGEALAKFFELNKGSAELATAISQVYLKDQVEPQLVSNLKGLKPGSAQYDAAIKSTLHDFMEQHPTMAGLAGLNDHGINQLSSLLPANALKETPGELESNVKDSLKEQFGNAPSSLKGLALVVSSYGFYSAVNEAINDPSAGTVFGAFTQALGFSQNAAAVAGLFQKTPSQVTAFGNGDSALGDIAGKVINVANVVGNLGNLGTDLQDGNTWGAAGSGAGAAGTLLDLIPEELVADGLQGGVDIVSDALTVTSAVMGVGQLLFSGPPQPPSVADQMAFLKSEGFTGLSQNALFDLLPQSSNPSSDAPGSSPWKLLEKYAEDNHYNLGNPSQRTAFVNWVNGLAAHPAAGNTYGAIGPDGKPVNQLASLVQNLEAELDYSKGNVSNFPAINPVSDANFAKVAQANQLTDAFSGNLGPRGVIDNNWGVSNDHVVTVNPRPSDAAVVAPQSAYQVDQLLQVIGARPLPPRP